MQSLIVVLNVKTVQPNTFEKCNSFKSVRRRRNSTNNDSNALALEP